MNTGDTSLPDTGLDSGPDSGLDTGLVLDTNDTGGGPPPIDIDTDPGPTVDTGLPLDTGPVYCPECLTAGELANDPGGVPCEEGCSSAGLGGGPWLPALFAAWLLLRRQRPR